MKKNLTKIFAMIMVASMMLGCTTAFAAAPKITGSDLGLTESQVAQLNKQDIYINNQKLVYDEATYGIAYITPAPTRTMIPMRVFAESFGLTVWWDSAAGCAKCEGPLGLIEMYDGEYGLTVAGEKRTFDQPTVNIRNGRTYVALRAFCNAIGITDENVTWRPGRIDITCDMDAIQGVPSSTIPSGIISADQWNPENMTKTLAKGEELINKYGEEDSYGQKGVNKVNKNELWFVARTNDKGSVDMTSYVDEYGLHFSGYNSSPDWEGNVSLEYIKTLLSETTSANVSTKAVAMLKDMNDREAKLLAEGEKLGYNEKYDTLLDEYDGWLTITSEALWDLGEGCYLSYGPTGYHIYNQGYIDRYNFSSLVKSYDSYVFMK